MTLIIQVEHPLSVRRKASSIASILAKKKAAGATHVLLDVPTGSGSKAETAERAVGLEQRFRQIGARLGLNIQVMITDGSQPIGNGVGPVLEAKDVLKVLRNESDAPTDLKERSLYLSGELLEFTGRAPPGRGSAITQRIYYDLVRLTRNLNEFETCTICTAILDWAKVQDIGFSTVVSMGGAADIDFGEVLDYLATDSKTTGILMYVEGIRDARRFLSGLKAAARLKPVILIKSGRHEAGCKAAMSHTGAMVGGDNVFDAAIARAGVVRAYSINELFSAARVLANNYVVKKDRLAIITNAGGPGVMSTDRAEDVGVQMAN